MAITVFAHTAFNGSRVSVSLYALSLQSSPLTVGLLISLYSVLPMLLSVSAGRMIDRVGTVRPIIASSVVLAAGVGLPALVPGLPALYAACTVIGVAFMVFHIAIQNAVASISAPEQRAVNYSWLALGFSISGFLGPTTAGLAIDGAGHRATFAFLAVPALVPALALAFAKPRMPRAHPGSVHGRAPEGPRGRFGAQARLRGHRDPRDGLGSLLLRDAHLRHVDRPVGLDDRRHPRLLRRRDLRGAAACCPGSRAACPSGAW